MAEKEGPKPEFVPEVGGVARGYMKWNENSLEWEYWLGNEKELVFSDFGLQMLVQNHKAGDLEKRVEIVVGLHHGSIVLRSVPLQGLRAFIRDTYRVDI